MKQQSLYTVQPRAWSWWRHQMETFSALLAICTGNSPVPGNFPAQRPVTRSFNVFFDLRPNKRLSKQSWGWWFATQCFPWWRHRNLFAVFHPCFGMCRWYRCSTSGSTITVLSNSSMILKRKQQLKISTCFADWGMILFYVYIYKYIYIKKSMVVALNSFDNA